MNDMLYKTEEFEGSLDLLLQLVLKNKMDILDIHIVDLVNQYILHIKKMQDENMDIASEFIQMATRLIYLKTLSLLPKSEESVKLKEELQGQLIEYQKCKIVAGIFSDMVSFDSFCRAKTVFEDKSEYSVIHSTSDLCTAYFNILSSSNTVDIDTAIKPFATIVKKQFISVKSQEIFLLDKLTTNDNIEYDSIFLQSKSKSELIAIFLALLEMLKENRIIFYSDDNNKLIFKLNQGGDTIEHRYIDTKN